MDIVTELDNLAVLRLAVDELAAQKKALLDAAIPPEVQKLLAEINAEFGPLVGAAETKAAELEAGIKENVLKGGKTVKGMLLQAVFNPGRITWDTKAMEGYRTSHPEIGQFRKEGQPYVMLK